MLHIRLIIAIVVLAVVPITAIILPVRLSSSEVKISINPASAPDQQDELQPISAGDIFSDEDRLSYYGYVAEKRHRKVREDYPAGRRAVGSWIDVSYGVLKRKGRVIARFDDNIYFGLGNNTRFGLFSFLDSPVKQIAVSRDVFRGGRQWILSLLPRPRIIFNGPSWAVGREGDDMSIIDLDHDKVFEIILPITDFYEFQDKLPIARIPLPAIVFKYDEKAKKYVPANHLFDSHALGAFGELRVGNSTDEIEQRAMVLEKMLALIYAGKQDKAWDFYNSSYRLDDKEELRRRITDIIVRQPVYKFIYNKRDPT